MLYVSNCAKKSSRTDGFFRGGRDWGQGGCLLGFYFRQIEMTEISLAYIQSQIKQQK